MNWAAVADLPDRDEAREWAEHELERAVYREAEPTLFDRLAKQIGDFLSSLFTPELGGAAWSPVWTVVIVAVIVALIVVAIVVWGVPRGERRTRTVSSSLLGDDERSAKELRAAAEHAIARRDWDEAVVLRFRAIARALDERGIIHAPPGMTAQSFVAEADGYFPTVAGELHAVAGSFDDVRYLRRHATEETATRVTELDDAIVLLRPAKTAEAAFA